MGVYAEWVSRFLADGHAYYCYCTPEELEARRQAAREAGGASGYDGHCRRLTAEQVAAYVAEGRKPVVRFRMPEGSTTFTDLVRGEVTFDHAHVPDFVLARADGRPLYTLAVAVDDVLMEITHVVRGEDLLSSTPRQIAVYGAMGVPAERIPAFAHLPYVLGPDGQRLSKRNGVVSINWYRQQGFLPEAICNYLALLGWSPGENREEFTLAEMAAEFDLARVNKNSAQFDVRKLEAINGDKIRALAPADFAARITPFLTRSGLVPDPVPAADAELIAAGAALIQTRISKLSDAVRMLGFLFVYGAGFHVNPEDAARVLTPEAVPALAAAGEGARRARRLVARGDRTGAPGRPDHRPGPEAARGVHPGVRRGHRAPRGAAAVRLDRTARAGEDAGPAGPGGEAGRGRRLTPADRWPA